MNKNSVVPSGVGTGVLAAAMAVSAVLLVARRDGLTETAWYVVTLVAVALGVSTLASALNLINVLRNRALMVANPGSSAFTSVRYTSLTEAMDRLGAAEERSIAPLPYFLSLSVDETGLGVWGGIFRKRRFCQFPWRVVANMKASAIDRPSFRGIVVGIQSASGTVVELPFILVGAGPFGTGAFPWARVEALLPQFEELRKRAIGSSSERPDSSWPQSDD